MSRRPRFRLNALIIEANPSFWNQITQGKLQAKYVKYILLVCAQHCIYLLSWDCEARLLTSELADSRSAERLASFV